MSGTRRRKQVKLALQGGGSHGAFTWGVLDRLLEDERLEIEAVSGASAGAMNAAVLADGLQAGGRAGARDALRRFWTAIGRAAPGGWMHALSDPEGGAAPLPMQWMAGWMALWSPRSFLPGTHALADIVRNTIDFDRVRRCNRVKVCISATHVQTGALKLFRQHELSADALMASACLPLLFGSVTVEGEAYWDGGFVGNPPLLPLMTEGSTDDLVLVQINPSFRQAVPVTPRQILDRTNEITFNGALLKDLRTLALVQAALREEHEPGHAPPRRATLFRHVEALRLHRIDAEKALLGLGAGSKLDAGWPQLQRLHRIGRDAADQWLQAHFTHLGRRGTVALSQYA